VTEAHTFAGRAAIAGIGATEFSKASGRSELSLATEAVDAALRDAGVGPSEVQGMVTYSTLAMLYLIWIGVRGESAGFLLWPTVVVHAILVVLLFRARFKEEKTPPV